MNASNLKEGESFLRLVSKEDRKIILEKSETKRFKKNEQIVRELDTDTNLYLINSGRVRVTLFSTEGKEVSFVDIEKGGNFGEFSAIDGKPRSANVIALSDSEITILPPDVFLWILENYPTVCIEILRQITGVGGYRRKALALSERRVPEVQCFVVNTPDCKNWMAAVIT